MKKDIKHIVIALIIVVGVCANVYMVIKHAAKNDTCFYGHKYGKWVESDGVATYRLGGERDVTLQTRTCERCGYKDVELLRP